MEDASIELIDALVLMKSGRSITGETEVPQTLAESQEEGMLEDSGGDESGEKAEA
jgi:hypothetical protein